LKDKFHRKNSKAFLRAAASKEDGVGKISHFLDLSVNILENGSGFGQTYY